MKAVKPGRYPLSVQTSEFRETLIERGQRSQGKPPKELRIDDAIINEINKINDPESKMTPRPPLKKLTNTE